MELRDKKFVFLFFTLQMCVDDDKTAQNIYFRRKIFVNTSFVGPIKFRIRRNLKVTAGFSIDEATKHKSRWILFSFSFCILLRGSMNLLWGLVECDNWVHRRIDAMQKRDTEREKCRNVHYWNLGQVYFCILFEYL